MILTVHQNSLKFQYLCSYMNENLYHPQEIALMKLNEEKETNVNKQYNDLLYKNNHDQIMINEPKENKRKISKNLKKKKRKYGK